MRVSADDQRPQNKPEDLHAIFHKLHINPDAQHQAFAQWLYDDLISNQHFICCNTLQEFQRQKYALSREAQIRRAAQHEKDDRRRLGDASDYVLGWDNRSKIEALNLQGRTKYDELESVRSKITEIDQQIERLNNGKGHLDTLISIEAFQEIDWHSEKKRQDDLLAEKQRLESASDKLKALQSQLNAVEGDIQQTTTQLKAIQETLANHRVNIQRYESDQQACDIELERIPNDAGE